MEEQKLIAEITSIIVNYTDDDGNIKSWKAGRIAERIVKNCNLQNVSISEAEVCPHCGSNAIIRFTAARKCSDCRKVF